MNEKEAFAKMFLAFEDEMANQTKQVLGTVKNMQDSGHELSNQAFSAMYSTAVGIAVMRAVSKLYPPV